MERLTGMFALAGDAYDAVYAPAAAAEIGRRVAVAGPPLTRAEVAARPDLLGRIDVLFSGWGAPTVDAAFLAAAPNLRAIFYGAGTISGWCTPAVWERGIVVTTANDANAAPVAEFTLSVVLFSLKHGWRLADPRRAGRQGFDVRPKVPGAYGSTVGLVGLGTIGRRVVDLLRPFDVTVLAYDPYLSEADSACLGVRRATSLAEVFATADVVSLHAADVPATRGMVTADLVATLRPGATLVNTARGSLVRSHTDLAGVLARRPDLTAVLDVTDPEPLPDGHPLLALPNVTITPHIAGSQGQECARLGACMVEELDRFLAGRPLRHRVRPDDLAGTVHQPAMAVPLHPIPAPELGTTLLSARPAALGRPA